MGYDSTCEENVYMNTVYVSHIVWIYIKLSFRGKVFIHDVNSLQLEWFMLI